MSSLWSYWTGFVIYLTLGRPYSKHICSVNYLKKHWEKFKAKSRWSKFTDVLFLALIIMVLTKDGRILLQRGILMSGLFSNVEANAAVPVTEANWNWKVVDLDGDEHALSSFAGKPIFLNFWATWCPPCNAEMPYIVDMADAMQENVVFIIASAEEPEKVKAFLADRGWDLPVYIIQSYPAAELQYTSLPTTFIIDATGTVVHRSEGMRKWTAESLSEMLRD
ncbi:MAG: TlpA family protein disulfide reductase [Flavobacteriales bacterium]|nr:TlpA family protein disulfide reductase [Flavobacteriales bacterium]